MKTTRSPKELQAEFEAFLAAPHGTKKHRSLAKQTWLRHFRSSLKTRSDEWGTLRSLVLTVAPKNVLGTEIIGALRAHLLHLQGGRCCYCRRWLQNVAHAKPIEHVLPRASYPQFSLHYKNLAVACYDCNAKKGKTNWSSLNKLSKQYPGPASYTDHFHPRFHIYDAHIRFVRIETNDTSIAIYVGRTPQGQSLCVNHLKYISQMDALCNHNRNLATQIKKLRDFGETNNIGHRHKFEEFLSSLTESVSRLAK